MAEEDNLLENPRNRLNYFVKTRNQLAELSMAMNKLLRAYDIKPENDLLIEEVPATGMILINPRGGNEILEINRNDQSFGGDILCSTPERVVISLESHVYTVSFNARSTR